MAKVVDITSKLSFKANPVIKIKGVELEVNSDAQTVLQIMGIYGNGNVSGVDMVKMRDLLFEKESLKKLEDLRLSFDDYTTVLRIAMNLATGDEDEEPEKQETPGMTS